MWFVWWGLAAASETEASAMVALRAAGAVVVERGEPAGLVGGGLVAEKALGHGWGVEGAVGHLEGRELAETPLELLIEKSAHAGTVEPYLGLGPALVVRSEHHEPAPPAVGGVAVAGVRAWLGERWGLLFEADAIATHAEVWSVGGEAFTGVGFRWR